MSVLKHQNNYFRFFLATIFLVVWNYYITLLRPAKDSSFCLQTQLVDSDNLNAFEALPVENVEECSICKIEAVEISLECKHSFCESCIFRWTKIKLLCPLCLTELKNDRILNKLLKERSKMDLLKACFHGRLDIVQFHIQNGTLYDSYSAYILLQTALHYNNFDIFELLIQNEADINSISPNPISLLFWECSRGHRNKQALERVKYLLTMGANPNILESSYKSPIIAACEIGHLEIVKALLVAGAEVNLNGSTTSPLHEACKRGHLEIIEILLTAGAKIDTKNKYKNTPLEVACKNGHLDGVRLLLDRGAKLESISDLINIAVKYEHVHIVECLKNFKRC